MILLPEDSPQVARAVRYHGQGNWLIVALRRLGSRGADQPIDAPQPLVPGLPPFPGMLGRNSGKAVPIASRPQLSKGGSRGNTTLGTPRKEVERREARWCSTFQPSSQSFIKMSMMGPCLVLAVPEGVGPIEPDSLETQCPQPPSFFKTPRTKAEACLEAPL